MLSNKLNPLFENSILILWNRTGNQTSLIRLLNEWKLFDLLIVKTIHDTEEDFGRQQLHTNWSLDFSGSKIS